MTNSLSPSCYPPFGWRPRGDKLSRTDFLRRSGIRKSISVFDISAGFSADPSKSRIFSDAEIGTERAEKSDVSNRFFHPPVSDVGPNADHSEEEIQ